MLRPRKFGLFFVALFSTVFLFVVFSTKAQAAASLYVDPPGGTFSIGSTFTVSLYVNTDGQAINAVEANLEFPPDKLQVVSPTTGKSFIQVWIAQPAYSNAEGKIRFQGTVPTPGINTNAGLVSTVTFRVKSVGTAALKILDTSRVLLNDGRGTDILGQTTDGIYNLTFPPPAGPIVTSRTHPDQEKWYSNNNFILEWVAPEDAEGYSYILSSEPTAESDDISEGLKTRVGYSNLGDGMYFFNIKALRQGVWGGVTTYVAKIDKTPPAKFSINVSPGERTSNNRPIFDFKTTDETSGIDHYEIKFIALDLPLAKTAQSETPFFIEALPPYSQQLADGRYQVVVRAYDAAGNYYQAEKRITIARPFLEIVSSEGLRVNGFFTLPWIYATPLLLAALWGLAYFARRVWIWHRIAEEQLMHGPHKTPEISKRIEWLKKKLKEYGSPRSGGGNGKNLLAMGILALIFSLAIFNNSGVFAQTKAPLERKSLEISNVEIEPPVVTLFPKAASNDEIVYIGGRAGAPLSKVLIYLQNIESGGTISYITTTDKDGAWFYSLPKFLNAGNYVLWTQLQVGEEFSPPSSRLDLRVERTAIQVGDQRLSFEDLYFILFIIFLIAFSVLLVWVLYHFYHGRKKHRRFDQAVASAEESLRRGFAVLRKDIEEELALIHKAKLNKELSAEERLREEKLLRDLEEVGRHVGQEVWHIRNSEG